jgi:hypothetical protein
MAGIAKEKDHTLSMQLPKFDIAPIDRAANLRGRSRTDFVREAGGTGGWENADGEHSPPHEPRPRGTLPVGGNQGQGHELDIAIHESGRHR